MERIKNWFIEWFRQWDNFWKGLCLKHGVSYILQGYEEKQICPKCWDETH